MKKYLIILVLLFISFISPAQDASVERSVFNIQTGFLGVWINNDAKLSPSIALRSEIGFDAAIFGGFFYPETGFLLAPVLTLEPRLYYNLENRKSKSKNIKNNSGNFMCIKASFNPDWFTISNYDNIAIINQLSVIPKWGIRRSLGDHFNFEAGFGIGYRYYFAKKAGYDRNASEVTADLHLRIGFNF
ncbi:MAG: hypothetical protein ABIR30_07010 [Chitinophagaceae bacterium]